jgi:alpha-glucosidase
VPNNWVSTFGGPAWTLDDVTGQYYLHNFTSGQPDLNWWSDDVRAEFDRILRFWFDRGVAGFRIDVAHMIVKDRELRDNPPATADDALLDQFRGQSPVYNSNRPEVHDVHRRWRTIADSYDPPRLLIGETFVDRVPDMIAFYGTGDELNLAFNIPLMQRDFEPDALREIVEATEAQLPDGCWPVWMGGNHDLPRFPTRWARGDDRRARLALLMLLGLRGTAFLYYGDELGLVDTPIPDDRILDPVGVTFPGFGRDPERTPMPWTGAVAAVRRPRRDERRRSTPRPVVDAVVHP